MSGCYRPIAPNIQATSFAVKLPFSGIIGIIGIAKILSLFFCGFQDSGILTSKPRRAPFVCKILIIKNTFAIIITHHGSVFMSQDATSRVNESLKKNGGKRNGRRMEEGKKRNEAGKSDFAGQFFTP